MGKLLRNTVNLTVFCIFSVISSVLTYEGTSFPKKYLEPEDIVPTESDLDHYLTGLKKILGAMMREPNMTCHNRAIGLFYSQASVFIPKKKSYDSVKTKKSIKNAFSRNDPFGAILKRTLLENKKKMRENHQNDITDILKGVDFTLSHFFYSVRGLGWSNLLKRFAELIRDDSLQVHAIADFNRYRLKKWLLYELRINEFAQEMDEATLPKEKYLEFIDGKEYKYYKISIAESDECVTHIIYNPIPQDMEYVRCVAHDYCSDILYRSPSVAYSLSHRFLNVMMPRHLRRCYMRSEERDDRLMETLCTFMYRETVYLARRGYFNRDMFMEHVALCGLLGYEEFHRRHWFRKVVSWIDKDGCIQENFNFELNRTRYYLQSAKNATEREKILKLSDEVMSTQCFYHQMSLALIMLAHGVRHAINFMKS